MGSKTFCTYWTKKERKVFLCRSCGWTKLQIYVKNTLLRVIEGIPLLGMKELRLWSKHSVQTESCLNFTKAHIILFIIVHYNEKNINRRIRWTIRVAYFSEHYRDTHTVWNKGFPEVWVNNGPDLYLSFWNKMKMCMLKKLPFNNWTNFGG